MNLFLIAVLILFGLAIFDLIAGVANDAVNFVNSAVGCRAASHTTILLVAAIGVLIGATFSSGMMEIAKSGVFSPDKMTFEDILIIFLAVLITDVILLDAFNTFGLPTSTTVSLVFELLGAAVVVSIWKILSSSGSLSELAQYINTAKALAIITGILTSVWISLSVSIVVQYFSRLLFSFDYQRRFKWIGGAWCGLSFASMSYFLLIKGLKGASFISEESFTYISEHTSTIYLILFFSGSLVAQLLIWWGVNVLRLLVLYGTASLAMAFAGNDLVNFIGPSVVALESYQAWSVSGIPADQYTMESLKRAAPANTLILLGAGAIMATTLFWSRKAKSVTETSISLARQDSGVERFKPNSFSRLLVYFARRTGALVTAIMPAKLLAAMESNFERKPVDIGGDQPAFDLIRATVNLTVASSLIAIGTNLKLPLSTTYVTFLVAMGTSLSDRAWGRETAVYRVAGVLNVIVGWFMTAFIAFVIAAFFATVIYFTGAIGVFISLAIACASIWHSFHLHSKREKEFSAEKKIHQRISTDIQTTVDQGTADAVELLQQIRRTYVDTLHGFVDEDPTTLKLIRENIKVIELSTEQKRLALFHRVAHSEPHELRLHRRILKVFDLGHDILLSLRDLVKRCSNHVLNSHLPPNAQQSQMLRTLAESMDIYLQNAASFVKGHEALTSQAIRQQKLALYQQIEQMIDLHIHSHKDLNATARNVESISRILMEAKDLVAISSRLIKHYDKRVRRGNANTKLATIQPETLPDSNSDDAAQT